MRTIKSILLPVCLIILIPVMGTAHPGHDHGGNFWQIFVHFLFTYYVYFIIALAIIGISVKYLQSLISRRKHNMIDNNRRLP